ncbi:MAG: hypothetical protein NTV86_12715 [Planctomycetota bacterium]|nr:hypothetical protein [Planctomycetota bacterium]
MSKTLRIGAARVNITPPPGAAMIPAPGRTGPSTGSLDPLSARAVVFADIANRPVVLISLDLFDLPRTDADALRVIAAEEVGTSADRVAVSCTHTHSGPATFPLRGEPIDKQYLHDLQEHVRKAVQLAWGRRKPARLTVGTAPLALGEGADGADESIRALLASDTAECPICVLLEYACHPACLPATNRLVSGDVAGGAAASLEADYGADVVVIYLNGCAGDIAPRPAYAGSVEALAAATALVAKAAHDAVVNASNAPQPPHGALDAIRAVIPLPCGKDAAGAPAFMPVGVTHLTLGPVELVTMSGEIFFQVGQELRRRTGRADLWVAAYCNGGNGHVAPDAALPAATAADETCGYLRPPLLPGAADKLLNETYRMLTTPRTAPKMEGRRGL